MRLSMLLATALSATAGMAAGFTTTLSGKTIQLPDMPTEITPGSMYAIPDGAILDNDTTGGISADVDPAFALFQGCTAAGYSGPNEPEVDYRFMAVCQQASLQLPTCIDMFVGKSKLNWACYSFDDPTCPTNKPAMFMPKHADIPDLGVYGWARKIRAYACFWVF